MNALISGCSFTHWPEGPGNDRNICWPSYLNLHLPNLKITNLAEPGAGNVYIANSIVRYVLENANQVDMVLVMWSGVTRLDFLTDLTDPAWHRLFDSYGFYRRVESCPNTLGYIFSGGQYGPWVLNQEATGLFKQMYKVSDQRSLAHINLIEIVKCQEFLQSRQIPYRFMSYVNYWHSKGACSPNGDFGVLQYPELGPLISSIDWNQWIFSDANKNGIYEMACANEDYHGDRFHPGADTNRRWAQLVVSRLPTVD